ncbi:MAG: hypothetical protein C5B44_02045, partial [Acidobacteria bacterium]
EHAANITKLAHELEVDPLGVNAKKSREWLNDRIHGVGLNVPECNLFDKIDRRGKYQKELSFQLSASVAAFVIEHPKDTAEDADARLNAGVDGMLKAYDSILMIEPTARLQFLDLLRAKRQTPEWNGLFREVMARCSPVPLSDRNQSVYSGSEVVYAPIEVSTPVKVTSKPNPLYPDQARKNGTQGTVVLLAVLTKTGRVTNIKVVTGLPDGLTGECVMAASRIRFEPAVRNGQPVSALVRLEYYFALRN